MMSDIMSKYLLSSVARLPDVATEGVSEAELAPLRDMFMRVKGRATPLTREQLAQVAVDADGEELDEEEWCVKMEAAEANDKKAEAVTDVAISTSIHSAAVMASRKLSKKTTDTIRSLVDKDEEVKVGPITLMFCLRADFGDALDAFPLPDSDSDAKNAGNGPWDKYTVAGKGTKKDKRSFYGDLAEQDPWGKACLDRKDEIAAKLADKTFVGDRKEAEKERDLCGKRFNAVRNLYRKAGKLHHQLHVANNLPLVGVEVETERKSTVPIQLYDNTSRKASTTSWADFSITQFNKIDFVKARDADFCEERKVLPGSYAAVVETLKRKTKDAATQVPAIKSEAVFIGTTYEYASYLATETGQKYIMKLLTDPAKNADTITAIARVASSLDGWWAMALRNKDVKALIDADETKRNAA